MQTKEALQESKTLIVTIVCVNQDHQAPLILATLQQIVSKQKLYQFRIMKKCIGIIQNWFLYISKYLISHISNISTNRLEQLLHNSLCPR